MGADLYMNKAYDKRMEEHRASLDKLGKHPSHEELEPLYDKIYKQGDVYFRDSYNSGSVMWAMGMSWWDDVVPMLDQDGNLSHEDTLKLVNMITDAPINVSTDFLENMPDEWTIDDAQKYLREEQQKLVSFLMRAVETDDTVGCSL
tara:strand:+ start:798 stop:1235 length:438 start_codon:yes stop_codon:yes gene_type:complete